jgi:4-amino-4-deoxy-L-arabinose transferase-like glycosyltransferase
MTWSDRLPAKAILSLIVLVYLVIGGLYAAYTPAWQAPDEPAHYNYTAYLAETGRFPVLHPGDYPHAYLEQIKAARFPPSMSVEPIRYEFWQPPLYYVLAAPVYRLFGGALVPLRLLSVLLGAGVVLAAYAVVLAVRPGDRGLALATAAFVAFVPMHLTMLASVNNDALAELLLAVVILRLIGLAARPPAGAPARPAYLAPTGLLLGLGLVTKATVYVAIPVALAALLWSGRRPGRLAGRALALFGPALALAVPWYTRNVAVYGWPDVLGIRNHDAVVVGQLRTADYLARVGWAGYLESFFTTTFHSFWGQFGWLAVPMDPRVYLALGLLSALMGLGLILIAGRRTSSTLPPFHPSTLLILLWLALILLVYVYYNLSLVQFQGRYLFPALIPLGMLGMLGLREMLARGRAWFGVGLCGAAALGLGVAGALGGDLDKWGLLIAAGAALGLLVRGRLPGRLDGWLLAAAPAGLACLSVYSLFVFIVPHLSP